MNEERLRVLQMVEQGTISAAEGATLLEQLVERKERGNSAETQPPRWMRVHISDAATGKSKVELNIPLDLVEVGLRMGARFVPNWEPAQYVPILQAARNGARGQMLNELSDGEKIEVFIK